jgi:hypothetical protein
MSSGSPWGAEFLTDIQVSLTHYDHFTPVFKTTLIKFLILLVGVESNWVHLAQRPLIGLLYVPRVIIMMMENLVN